MGSWVDLWLHCHIKFISMHLKAKANIIHPTKISQWLVGAARACLSAEREPFPRASEDVESNCLAVLTVQTGGRDVGGGFPTGTLQRDLK